MKLLLPLPLKNLEMMPTIRAEGAKVILEFRYARTYDQGHLPAIIQADLGEAICVHQALGEAIETARKVRSRAPKKVTAPAVTAKKPAKNLLDAVGTYSVPRPADTSTKSAKAVVPTGVKSAKKKAQRSR
jgi:hypothetical protein